MNFTFDTISDKLDSDIDSLTENKEYFVKVADSIPELLQRVGLLDRPLYLPREKIIIGLNSPDNRNHGHKNEIGKKTLKKSLPHLGDPLAITYTEKNAFGVYLEDKASTGKPLYVYIRYDDKRDINVILSVYGRISTDSEKYAYVDDTKLRRKWDTTDHIVQKFKKRLEGVVFRDECLTKTSIKRGKV